MPVSGKSGTILVDTSVAVALVVADHALHEQTFRAFRGRTLGLAGHAAF
jgi:predicted nucleic acid-binding protein